MSSARSPPPLPSRGPTCCYRCFIVFNSVLDMLGGSAVAALASFARRFLEYVTAAYDGVESLSEHVGLTDVLDNMVESLNPGTNGHVTDVQDVVESISGHVTNVNDIVESLIPVTNGIIAFGSIVFFISIFGGYGACCKIIWMLYLYFSVLVAITLLDIGLGVALLIFKDKLMTFADEECWPRVQCMALAEYAVAKAKPVGWILVVTAALHIFAMFCVIKVIQFTKAEQKRNQGGIHYAPPGPSVVVMTTMAT